MTVRYNHKKLIGFTIVELLVVIVVIGILAAITIVAYNGIRQKAISASLQSDLTNASKQVGIYQAEHEGNYPDSVDDCPTPSSGNLCIKTSGSNSFAYQVDNNASKQSFSLIASNDNINYRITDGSAPTLVSIQCPIGFIVVPGSATYSTSDFCVMKYEAKQDPSNTPVSRSTGSPWDLISQTNAITYSVNVSGCIGCHLISESEWLTIAQNVLSVASNWSGGAVGVGYIYSGHNDNNPSNPLVASSVDSDGYYNTGNSSDSQKRTLTLSNGEVIWDFSGNIREWVNKTTTGGQPGVDGGGYSWRQWKNITNPGTFSPNPSPTTTGISGSNLWDTDEGIGGILSSSDDTTTLRAVTRGGGWADFQLAGVMNVFLNNDPGSVGGENGFRVAK